MTPLCRIDKDLASTCCFLYVKILGWNPLLSALASGRDGSIPAQELLAINGVTVWFLGTAGKSVGHLISGPSCLRTKVAQTLFLGGAPLSRKALRPPT